MSNLDFFRTLSYFFFSYTRHTTSYRKDVKGPVQFREKLRPGEALEWAWFGDIQLIGMYFLGDSSHKSILGEGKGGLWGYAYFA